MLAFYLSAIPDTTDKSKFELLYNTYKNLMLYKAYTILQDKSLAEDAVHNAFIKILKKISKYDFTDSHKTSAFVVIVVENVAKTMYKKEHKILPVELGDIESNVNLAEAAETRLDAEYIASKIAQLPPLYRDILTLKFLNELSDKEIASVLGITNSNARKRLQRAKTALLKLLKGGEIDA